jgi:5-methylcytosine-specific restriction endonuclease McrA
MPKPVRILLQTTIATTPDDWHIVRSIVLERDGYACTYCGADKQLEGDHVVPLSRGGSNALVNLATACRR